MNSMMSKIGKHADLAAAGGIVLIVAMLIIPLPPLLLDFFITINISAALMIVVATMYVPRALDFSAFPTLLHRPGVDDVAIEHHERPPLVDVADYARRSA